MKFEEIKTRIAELSHEQQDHLAAYLVHLRHARHAGIRREITTRINDKNPDHWVSLKVLKENWRD